MKDIDKSEEIVGAENTEPKKIQSISIASLIAAADKVKESTKGKESVVVKVERLEELLGIGEMELIIPNTEILMAAITTKNNENIQSVQDLNIDTDILVYRCLVEPDLSSKELRKAFGVNKNIDVMKALLKPHEITSIAEVLTGKMKSSVSLVSKVKN